MRHLFKTRIHCLIVLLLVMLSLASFAQQHFIYIQADNKQPFSLKLNGRYYSSSSIGYIILPKLADSTYTITINFALNAFPEQTFTLTVAGKDYGYALKNFDTKGWGLFNFQTSGVVMNNTAAATPQAGTPPTVTNTSAFGNMLADVVNDKSINTLSATDTTTATIKTAQTAVTDTLKAALDTITNTITQNSDAAKATDTLNKIAADNAPADTTFTTTGVIKAAENTGDKGTDLTFIDFSGTHNDTIKAFIPAIQSGLPAIKDTVAATAATSSADSTGSHVNNPFYAQHNNTITSTADSSTSVNNSFANNTSTDNTTPAKAMAGACTNMASEGDVNKLKKKIIALTGQDAILQTIKKSLKNKCISTGQVKDLGNLFLNDDTRYGFYDTVYPFVYDAFNYASLQSTLIDPYYKNRFKALLR